MTSLFVLIVATVLSAMSSFGQNSFAKPDFAFPQTVQKNADKVFVKAIKSRTGSDALQAAVQLCVASSMISNDSYQASLARFDSVATFCGQPCTQLARLLEARLYNEIYSANSYVYNTRKIPSQPVPDNVMEWNRAMFADKIEKLVEEANSHTGELAAIPIADISSVLIDTKDAIAAGFSVADFIAIQSVELLRAFANNSVDLIPFGATSTANAGKSLSADDLLMNYIDGAISRHKSDSNLTAEVFFALLKADYLPIAMRKDYILSCYEQFKDSSYGASIVNEYANQLTDRRQKFDLLNAYKSKFPDAPQIGLIESSLNVLTDKYVNLRFDMQLLPHRESVVKVSGTNIYNFYILAYKIAGNERSVSPTYAQLKAMQPVAVVPVSIDSVTPAQFDLTATIPGLPAGLYTFVPSATSKSSDIISKNLKSKVSVALVSDLSTFITYATTKSGRNLYIVSALNQAPLKGVRVALYPYKSGKKGSPIIKVTDANGKIDVDNSRYFYRAENNGSFIDGELYNGYVNNYKTTKSLNANVLTNLSIYHPGDTVKFVAIAYTTEDNIQQAAANRELRAVLFDANYQGVDTLNIITDKYGRVASEFAVAKSGLLGNWTIRVLDGDNWLGSASFAIADYKSPTFFVTVDSASDASKVGDTLIFKGKAITYAGMPVANAKVEYNVSYQPKWWRAAASSGSYGGEVVTDDAGNFTITLGTEGLRNTPYAQGAFNLTASVTNPVGETQTSVPVTFSIGNDMYVDSRLPQEINAAESNGEFQVVVSDIAGHPVVKTVFYRVSVNGKKVAGGEFESPNFKFNLKDIPSGRYVFDFSLNENFKPEADSKLFTNSVTIWRPTDKRSPYITPLWVPEKQIVAPQGSKSVKVKVGSSYPDSYILAVVSDDQNIIESKWIKVSDSIAEFSVNTPDDNRRVYVHFMGEHNLNRIDQIVTLIPNNQSTKLEVAAQTFRDRIAPGVGESWRFKFTLDGKPCSNIAVAAVMSNAALNAIEPFIWQFDPSANRYWSNVGRFNFTNVYQISNSVSIPSPLKAKPVHYFSKPELNTYGERLFQRNTRFGSMRYKAQMRAAGNSSVRAVDDMKGEVVVEEVAMEIMAAPAVMAGAVTTSGADSTILSVQDSSTSDVVEPLRQVDMAEAFFYPCLATDSDGIATVDFTAPDFVGTWQFQLMGYSSDMKGATLLLNAVSAKKVMAQMNAPRFVRTGDKATFGATAYNNSDESALIGVTIELINPVDGSMLLKRVFDPTAVASSASRTEFAELSIPADISAIIVRTYATVGDNSDGEQTVIPVLPSSTPLVESTPFYIGNSQTDFKVKLPKFDKNAKVTLIYCDNPVWECVTALPAMLTPKSVNVLSKAYALYGNAVSASLFDRYPMLITGLQQLAADSALVSPLMQNPELKTVLLNNTPWVNNSSSETLRMQQLLEFADKDKSATAVANMMRGIVDSQNANGGWSWCPDMKTSSYITGRVVHILASLADMGCLPEGGKDVAKKAIKYLDNEYARQWNESKRKNLPVTELLNYLADKNAFKGVGSTKAFSALDAVAMKAIKNDWRDFGIGDKATAAILFERRDNHKLATTLLESLRQFASVSTQKGMWFDNLNFSGWGMNPLLSTARVLDAYCLIAPTDSTVDLLRQWLLVSKQTQDWGDDRATAAAIHSIIVSGTKAPELSANHAPKILLNGKALDIDANRITGSITFNLDPKAVSGATLRVVRINAGPAWGGVVAQYIAPILDVKQVKTPQISITKNVYVVKNDSNGVKVSNGKYAVGDRVRITLTITTDRELDYVAITDPRAACLEPVEQLSGYTSSDAVWYYREVRDSQTNLFIPYLSKGTHVINYECTVDRSGDYSLGVAMAQSQYAPTITAHSAGRLLFVQAN